MAESSFDDAMHFGSETPWTTPDFAATYHERDMAMLPSRNLEYRVLKVAMIQSGDWRPTTLPQLSNDVGSTDRAEVVDALKRLNRRGHIELRKYGIGSVEPYLGDDRFFYTDGFEFKIAPEGRPYLEELERDSRTEAVPPKPSPAGDIRARRTLDWSLIHPTITTIAKRRFDDGHVADAAEAAFKEVNIRVKAHVREVTGDEFDGADLMRRAFSLKKQLIVLDDLSTETGRSIQQGYMEIFAGAMLGIRNPKAHDNLIIDDVRGIHFLFVASLLMSKLDEANVPALDRAEPTGLTTWLSEAPPVTPVPKDPNAEVRAKILLMMASHEDNGTGECLMDSAIAERLAVDVQAVHKHLLILEDQGTVRLSKAMGPTYGARLTPSGLVAVEQLKSSIPS